MSSPTRSLLMSPRLKLLLLLGVLGLVVTVAPGLALPSCPATYCGTYVDACIATTCDVLLVSAGYQCVDSGGGVHYVFYGRCGNCLGPITCYR